MTDSEVGNRINVLGNINDSNFGLNPTIITDLLIVLGENNVLVKVFRNAREDNNTV